MHDMPTLSVPSFGAGAERRADLLERALRETDNLSGALALAQRAWDFIAPYPPPFAVMSELSLAFWGDSLEPEPPMPAANAASAPAGPPTPVGASDGLGTQVAAIATPVRVDTETVDPAPAPLSPIPQIYQPRGEPTPSPVRPRTPSAQPPKPWTENEEADLRRLYTEGKTDKQIAHALHRTSKAVAIRCAKLGLARARQGKDNDGDGG